MIFGPLKLAKQLSIHPDPLATNVNTHTRNLGVIFDSELKFDNAVVKGSFFSIQRSIAKLKSFLSFKDTEMVIHAVILSRLDYNNSLYLGLSKTCSSISPVLASCAI